MLLDGEHCLNGYVVHINGSLGQVGYTETALTQGGYNLVFPYSAVQYCAYRQGFIRLHRFFEYIVFAILRLVIEVNASNAKLHVSHRLSKL